MNLTDQTLLNKIKTGDRAAFMILYERYWNSLYAFVLGRTKNREVAEEITLSTLHSYLETISSK